MGDLLFWELLGSVGFGRVEGCDEHTLDFFCKCQLGAIIVGKEVRPAQQSQPIYAFSGFLQGNVEPRNEISLAVSVNSSLMLAPMLVAERRSCLAMVVSLLVLENAS